MVYRWGENGVKVGEKRQAVSYLSSGRLERESFHQEGHEGARRKGWRGALSIMIIMINTGWGFDVFAMKYLESVYVFFFFSFWCVRVVREGLWALLCICTVRVFLGVHADP
ncbi:hypothetical protein STSP2_02497 [Anaerohalosphaera lusitana]|uniref:Uncharacterized protein n=1 Tax=Anaerohalosphaera lusitana TaxID=1936003 RepID=A0A1U9NNJ9_9BACT|nr:hypothetical protein STSP2_02497 [Anaerohalosphaera lusitana]